VTDIAQLSYSVNSSGLENATKALDANATAAENVSGSTKILEREYDNLMRTANATGAAIQGSEDRYRSIAQQAMAWAEANQAANFSERALAEAARDAAQGIDWKAQVMARAGTEQERMAQRVEAMRLAEQRLASQQEATARATQAQELNLKQLLGQIDPTIAKLEKLADMEERLHRASELGLIKPEVFQQYQDKIDVMRSATLNAGKASDVMTRSLGDLNLQAVHTQQSVASLVRALANGQWGQAQASMTSLTARTGLLGSAFTGAGLAIGGAGLAIGAFAIMAAKGYIESRRLEGVIIGMGSAAGFTAGQVLDLRNEIGNATGDYKVATQAVNQLLLSGKLTGEALESVARSASNLASLTGQSVGSIASEIETLSDGAADSIQKLNDKYGFLTIETYNHLRALRDEEGQYAANKYAIEELERVSADRVQKMRDSAGILERAWIDVGTALDAVKRSLLDIGRNDPTAKIATAERLRNMSKFTGPLGPLANIFGAASSVGGGAMGGFGRKEQWTMEAEALQKKAEAEGASAKATRDMIAAEEEAKKESKGALDIIERRIASYDKEAAKLQARNEIIAAYNKLSISDPNNDRLYDGSQEKMLRESDKKIDEQFARRANRGAAAANRLADRMLRADNSMEKYIRKWQTELDGTGNKVMDEFERRMDTIAEKVAEFERLKVPADKIAEFKKEMIGLAEGIRDKDIAEYLQDFEFATRGLTSFLVPGADALLRFEEAITSLRKEMESGILTEEAYIQRVLALQKQRDSAAISLVQSMEDELQTMGMSADEQEIWNNLRRAGVSADSDFGRTIIETTKAIQQQREAIRDQIEIMDAARDSTRGLFDDLYNGVGVLKSLENAFGRFADALFAWASNDVVEQLFGKRGDTGSGPAGGWLGNLLGSMFGGGNASGSGNSDSGSIMDLLGSFGSSGFFGGGRDLGGDLRADRFYRVGERNVPELAKIGNHQFLIPGDRGRVDTMKTATTPHPQINLAPTIVVQGRPDKRTRSHIGREMADELRFAQRSA